MVSWKYCFRLFLIHVTSWRLRCYVKLWRCMNQWKLKPVNGYVLINIMGKLFISPTYCLLASCKNSSSVLRYASIKHRLISLSLFTTSPKNIQQCNIFVAKLNVNTLISIHVDLTFRNVEQMNGVKLKNEGLAGPSL